MIKGYYKHFWAIPCHPSDEHYFRKMMTNIPFKVEGDVFVKQVKIGDILVSETDVIRWRIVSENGKLYLGFYETPPWEKDYEGLERPKAYYLVEKDTRKNTSQKYMLLRIPRWVAMEYMNNK